MFKSLLRYFKGYTGIMLLTALLIILEVVCELQIPLHMARIIDIGVENSDSAYILQTGARMIGICIIAIIFGIINKKTSALASQGFAHNLRVSLFNKVQDLSFANIDRFTTASLITRLTNDVNTIQSLVLQAMRLLVRAPIMIITALFIALTISAKIAMVLLISTPLLLAGISIIMIFTYRLFMIVQKKIDQLNRTVQENLISVRVVKSFVRKDYEKKKFLQANEEMMQASLKAGYVGILNSPVAGTIMNGTALFVYWLGASLIWGGEIKTGDLLSISTYIVQIMVSLNMISMLLINGAKARACAVRVTEVLETKIDITSPVERDESPVIRYGRVEFRNVSFSYEGMKEGEQVLKNISFTAEPGQTVAILGGTGSGKSSLVKLIPRFYDPDEGSILIDGRDIRDYHLEELRGGVGMVFQNNVLFSGSVKDNLLWGKWEATDEEITSACTAGQIHSFIDSLPRGYDTLINQDGVNVSGGQRQRLCISRVLLKKPPILIMDDSTSALDTATEERLRHALKKELFSSTVFIIAQRISSVKHADKIILLDDGEISAIGTHQTLLEESAIYREINHSQKEGVMEA